MAPKVAIKISDYEKDKERSKRMFTPWLAATTLLTCIGSSLLTGYNIGVLNTPTKVIVSFYNETYWVRYRQTISTDLLDVLWTVTVAIFVFVAMLGAFSTGMVADRVGRKKGLLLNHVFLLVGTLMQSLTKTARAPELLILGRAFVGFNCGLTFGLAPLYLTEVSPTAIRGAVGSCHQLAVTVGILISQVLGLTQILGTAEYWPWLLAVAAVPALVSAALLPLCPESPRYLLMGRGDEKAAVTALRRLRATDDLSAELEEMQRESKETVASTDGHRGGGGGGGFSASMLFRHAELRRPMLVALVVQLAQQWSGINCIFFYSESIFESAGVGAASIPYAIVATGAINVLVTLASVHLIERLGRRSLLLYPMCVMALSTIIITVSLNLQNAYHWMPYVSIGCVVLFIIGFALGLGSITQLLCSELFRQEPRPTAMAISQGVNWTSNFLLTMSFKFMMNAMTTYIFLFFLSNLALCIVFIFFFVPETKNRTFDEISRDLQLGPAALRSSRSSTALLMRRSRSNTPLGDSNDPNELHVQGYTHSLKPTFQI